MSIVQTLQDTAQQVTSGGSGFFGNLVSSPLGALSGLVSGAFSGALSGLFWIGLPLLGIFTLLPGVRDTLLKYAGPKLGALGEKIATMDLGQKLLALGGVGAALGGAWGGVKGAVSGGMGASQDAQGNGSSLPGIIGTGVVLAAVSAIAIGAVHHIQLDDGNAKLPDGAPKGPQPGGNGPGRA